MCPKYPAIVGAVADAATLDALPALEAVAACDLLEFRIDALQDLPLLQERIRNAGKPVLITVRDPAEGGVGNLGDDARGRLLGEFMPFARLIDIEIRNLAGAAALVEEARKQDRTVVGSFHDFRRTPSLAELEDAARRGIDRGAHIIKVAVDASQPGDLATLLTFLEKTRETIPVAAMGMGALGMSSRLVLAQAGSRLNYAYLHQPNAAGQWHAAKLRSLFGDLGIPPN